MAYRFTNNKSGSNSPYNELEGEYVMENNEQLYKDIKSYFSRFIDTNETEIGFLVMYSTGTHYFKEYETYPILHITGNYETGKNRRLDIMEIFCYEPIILTSPTLSSLFRFIDERKGTILVDEADVVLRYQEFENALLAGYKKGGQISRSKRVNHKNKDFTPEMYSVYCPKVVVTRDGLPSDALRSRSVTIITFPKTKGSTVPDILREKDKLEGKELRKELDSLLSQNKILESHDIELNLSGRKAEIFDCLSDVAYMYGEEAINDLKKFVESIYIPETGYTTMMTLNEDIIRVLFENWESTEKIYLKDIKANLQQRSGDYTNTHEKQIAGSLRGLNFELARDSHGTYVVKSSKVLETWLERYPISKDDLESSDFATQKPEIEPGYQEEINSSVANVANEGKSEKDRPKRVSPIERLDTFRRNLLRRR